MRRLVILTPMMTAIVVAGGVTAALAFIVLPANDHHQPEPRGTTIAAPSVAETPQPTAEATEERRATATEALPGVDDAEIAQVPQEGVSDAVVDSTPTPRVI